MDKSSIFKKAILSLTLLTGITTAGILSCKKNNSSTLNYRQTNLVADTTGYSAGRVDTNLDNPWGIAIGATGALWIAANHSGLTEIYDGGGNQLLAPVTLGDDLSSSGVVYNSTSSFIIPGTGQPAKFIYVSEDGVIVGWNAGDTSITMADRSAANAVYKGVAIANDGTGDFLYATDFHNGKVDVFDKSFNLVTRPFSDPNIPVGFAPFNIQNIGGQLYVTYAMQKGPDNEDDQSGAGNGYVDVYNPNGTLVKRFASQGTLNSPWGIAQAPSAFGQGNNAILIANFGDGRINVFDASGKYTGQLMNGGAPVSIDGLWAITFPQTGMGNLDPNKLYFTAGPQSETYGIFGYLQKQ